MKGFLIPLIQGIFLKKTIENNCLKAMLVPVLLFIMPLYAENNYLFPSDIIDQSEQAIYDAERANRYAAQRKWTYPEEDRVAVRPETHQTQYPNSNQYPATVNNYLPNNNRQNYDSSQYDSHGDDSFPNKSSQFNAPRPSPVRQGSVRYPESESYQYNNYHSSQYRAVNKIPGQQVPHEYSDPDLRLNSHPRTGKVRPFPGDMEAVKYPGKTGKSYGQTYPNLLYPSDVESVKRSIRQNYEANFYNPQKQTEQPKQRVEIRYIPVPVYNVPGSRSRNVLGITPGNGLTGISHLGPDSNSSGINNLFGTQFNPLTSFGVLPAMGNPSGNVFSSYGNNTSDAWPISAPGLMMPSFSSPEMFNSVMP